MEQVIVYDDKIRIFLVRTPKKHTILLIVFGPGPLFKISGNSEGALSLFRGGLVSPMAGWEGHRERSYALQGVLEGVGAPDDFEILDQARDENVIIHGKQ